MAQVAARGNLSGQFNWKPEGCALQPAGAFAPCLRMKHVVFVGDSLAREVFWAAARVVGAKPGEIMLNSSRADLKGCKPHRLDECAIVSNAKYDAAAGGSVRFIWSPVVTREQSAILSSPYVEATLKRADYVVFSTGMWEMGLKRIPLADYIPWALEKIELLKAKIGPGAALVVFPHHWIHLNPKHTFPHLREGCNSGGKLAIYRAALTEAAVCAGVEVFDTSRMTRFMKDAPDGVHYAGGFEAQLLMTGMCRKNPPFVWSTPDNVTCSLPAGAKTYIDEFARQNLTYGCMDHRPINSI
eukprot:gene18634-28740_t